MKLSLILVTMAFFSNCSNSPTGNSELKGKPMPTTNLLKLDSITQISTGSFVGGKPMVFFYFTPICPYCNSMTKELVQNIKSMNDVQFYMVSNSPLNDLKKYEEYYQLAKYTNITLLQDYSGYLINYFGIVGVPYIIVFDKEKKVKRIIGGQSNIKALKEIILEQ